MKQIFEIFVPCQWNDGTPVRTRHHRAWDEKVRRITGGLTVYSPVKGQWVFERELYSERMIPVRIMCTASEMLKIVNMTIIHYEQLAVMYYCVADRAWEKRATPEQKSCFYRERTKKEK